MNNQTTIHTPCNNFIGSTLKYESMVKLRQENRILEEVQKLER